MPRREWFGVPESACAGLRVMGEAVQMEPGSEELDHADDDLNQDVEVQKCGYGEWGDAENQAEGFHRAIVAAAAGSCNPPIGTERDDASGGAALK